jgi:DNA-dependent RNA polymerase auxiliary subunit epsilon
MAHYYNTRHIRIQRTIDELELQKKMAKRVKDFENNIIPDIIDGRTKSEKLQDKYQQEELVRKLVFNLFDDDPEYSVEYIRLINEAHIDLELFQVIYDDLEKRFKGKNIRPQNVMITTKLLSSNFINSGNTITDNKTITNKLNNIVTKLNDIQFNTNYAKQDATDKINALQYLYSNIFNDTELNGISELNKNELSTIKKKITAQIDELIRLFDEHEMDPVDKNLKFLELINNIKGSSIAQAQRILSEKVS